MNIKKLIVCLATVGIVSVLTSGIAQGDLLKDLTEDASPGDDSLVYTVDDPAGTAVDRKTQVGDIHKAGTVATTGLAVGASYTETSAPTNGAIIEGNVGIGTTTMGGTLTVSAPASADALSITVAGVSSKAMFIDSDGNIGVGTDTPAGLTPNGFNQGPTLEVKGNSTSRDSVLALMRSDNITGSYVWHDGSGWDMYIDNLYTNDDADIFIRTKTGVTPINAIVIKGSGNVGIGTSSPSQALDVNSDSVRIRTNQSPGSADACDAGEIAWDASYIYVCTASGAWKRAALTGGY